jgi:hypothetical protein
MDFKDTVLRDFDPNFLRQPISHRHLINGLKPYRTCSRIDPDIRFTNNVIDKHFDVISCIMKRVTKYLFLVVLKIL